MRRHKTNFKADWLGRWEVNFPLFLIPGMFGIFGKFTGDEG
jgi:hypothetical protein